MSAIGIQGKLGYHQKLSVNILQGQICLSVLVFKDSKSQHFFQIFVSNFSGVILTDSYKNQEALSDFAYNFPIYAYLRMVYPLYQ